MNFNNYLFIIQFFIISTRDYIQWYNIFILTNYTNFLFFISVV